VERISVFSPPGGCGISGHNSFSETQSQSGTALFEKLLFTSIIFLGMATALIEKKSSENTDYLGNTVLTESI
jgi:hypothetical protein